MKKLPRKKQRRLTISTIEKVIFAHTLLAYAYAKHRRHAAVLATLLFVLVISIATWFTLEYQRLQQMHKAKAIVSSKYEDIKIASTTFDGSSFHGYTAYALTENHAINMLLQNTAMGYFQPCKDDALANTDMPHECQVDFTIDFATQHHMQVTYTYEAFRNRSPVITHMRGLLFDRKRGLQLPLSQLFKPGVNYLDALSRVSREQLSIVEQPPRLHADLGPIIERTTQPRDANFSNFVLTEDEKISFIFNGLARYTKNHKPVVLQLEPDKLYTLLSDHALRSFFPKLKEQKEAERKLAEAATYVASQTKAARNHTRQQVAPNRSNINCAVMKCIALTFDDGPSAYTNQVLDVLAARRAVATFFVLGNQVASGAAILQKAIGAHNEIANHSWSHADLTMLSDTEIAWQVEQTNQVIFQTTGSYPKLMRPPYGAVDSRVASQIGMPLGLWSVDPNDWLHRDATLTYQHIMAHASPGAIILLHDIYPSTAQIASIIVDELQRQGYILVTVSELFGIDGSNASHFIGHLLRRR